MSCDSDCNGGAVVHSGSFFPPRNMLRLKRNTKTDIKKTFRDFRCEVKDGVVPKSSLFDIDRIIIPEYGIVDDKDGLHKDIKTIMKYEDLVQYQFIVGDDAFGRLVYLITPFSIFNETVKWVKEKAREKELLIPSATTTWLNRAITDSNNEYVGWVDGKNGFMFFIDGDVYVAIAKILGFYW